ncbi:hypothetical protein ABH982_003124 [Bradyrhizobium ottawaense]
MTAVERGGDRDHHDQQRQHHAPHVLFCHPRLRRRLLRALAVLVHDQHRKGDTDQDRDHAGNDEGETPAEILADHAGDQRRGGNAEIAPDAVDAHLAAEPVGIRHDHGGADGMIDRGEDADGEQRGAELHGRLHEADRDHGGTNADEEDQHHVAAAPAVPEPAGQQRAGTERDEARRRVRQQLRIGHAERRPHDDHGGGKDQHRIMVDEMACVDETDDPAGAVHYESSPAPK